MESWGVERGVQRCSHFSSTLYTGDYLSDLNPSAPGSDIPPRRYTTFLNQINSAQHPLNQIHFGTIHSGPLWNRITARPSPKYSTV